MEEKQASMESQGWVKSISKEGKIAQVKCCRGTELEADYNCLLDLVTWRQIIRYLMTWQKLLSGEIGMKTFSESIQKRIRGEIVVKDNFLNLFAISQRKDQRNGAITRCDVR